MPDFPSSRREIAGVPIQQLSEQFGTPTFAYIGETIVQRIRDPTFSFGIYIGLPCPHHAKHDRM